MTRNVRRALQAPDVVVNRPDIGTGPYAQCIYSCNRPGEIALTFEDGPLEYTRSVVEHLRGLKCTFFVMLDNEKALAQVLDTMPTYMRRPFGSFSEELLKEIGNIGYHIAHWSIGTKDFEHDTESQYRVSIKRFDKDLEAGGAVALTHDTKFYTADKLLPHMIA
ncbi:polysaccharide deacetylase [Seiridium cupressi]